MIREVPVIVRELIEIPVEVIREVPVIVRELMEIPVEMFGDRSGMGGVGGVRGDGDGRGIVRELVEIPVEVVREVPFYVYAKEGEGEGDRVGSRGQAGDGIAGGVTEQVVQLLEIPI